MKVIFLFTLACIIYIYIGYRFILKAFVEIFKINKSNYKPTLYNNNILSCSIIICVYNEDKHIKQRVENILELDFPKDMIEVIVASDGSTDKTVEIARMFEPVGIKVISFERNRGRGITQNETVKIAKGEVVVFTDAETRFEKGFLRKILGYFGEERVGCVVGNLGYVGSERGISQAEGFYWRFEKQIRELESKLGILGTGSGACMAVRRELWRDLSPIDDCDFTTPLDVILSGNKVVYAPDALAYDVPPASIIGELRARVRQTSRNLVGTLKRWSWRGWVKFPLVSWGLLSHKLLRWFTPFFLLAAFISNVTLLDEGLTYQAAL